MRNTIPGPGKFTTLSVSDAAILDGQCTFRGQSVFNGQLVFNGQPVFNTPIDTPIYINSTITQDNTGLNINQTDHTINDVGNILRATQIYGDLQLLKPTGGVGGAFRLEDVRGLTPNNFMQIFHSGLGARIYGQSPGGFISLNQSDISGTSREIYHGTAAGTRISMSATDYAGPILNVTEVNTGNSISIYPNSLGGSYNPVVLNGDNQILCVNDTINNTSFVVGANSTECNGLKIITSTTPQTTTIGQGGVNGVFTTSFSCDGTNSTINGPALFSSTTPPKSSQLIPLPGDSSNKIPTTAWVQTAITAGASPMPYYQAYYFINAPQYFDRSGYFQFNFTGANWGVNDYFSFSLRCSLTTTALNSTALAPNYTTITAIVDVYPNRCPANNTNPSAYGSNPTQSNVTNFSLANGYIYNGAGLQSSYVVSPAGGPYAPFGRWYWVNNYSLTPNGTTYPTSSPAPINPYIAPGTAQQSAFGFGVWNTQLVQTNFAIEVELINRGPGRTGQEITLTSNYSTSGGSTLKEFKVGL